MNLPPYQPLRIPPGWRSDWNTLFELDPTAENIQAGFFGGSSLLLATHDHRRFAIDVEWRPDDDPTGSYRVRVIYALWSRHADGRRRKGEPLDFDWQNPVHEFTTQDRIELVRELETWFLKCAGWVVESN